MASIIVTFIMMIIITLVVIGFARLIRREQRQSLDEQLSTQAFYAAESGVNQAVDALRKGYNKSKKNCGPDDPVFFSPDSNILDKDTKLMSYPCLLIDTEPIALQYDRIETTKSTIIPISTQEPIKTLSFSWQTSGFQGQTHYQNCPASGSFPKADQWPATDCDAGILRIDVAATPDDGTLDRQFLLDNTFTAFLVPFCDRPGPNGCPPIITPPPTATFAQASRNNVGEIIPVKCQTDRRCALEISGGLNGTSYAIRVRSVYQPNSLVVVASNASGQQLKMSGAQAAIDVTGKANDVLRRISVRVKLSNDYDVPDFAIQSRDSICKRLALAGSPTPAVDNGDPACQVAL